MTLPDRTLDARHPRVRPLRLPNKRPKYPDQKFVIADIAYKEAISHGPVIRSQRQVQGMLRRATGSRVSNWLTDLEGQGFLKKSRPDEYGKANEWTLHPDLSREDRSMWADFGEALVAPRGLVGALLERPSVKSGHVTVVGFAILGLLRELGHATAKEVEHYLNALTSNVTLGTRLALLCDIGAITDTCGVFSLEEDYLGALARYEVREGLDVKAENQDEVFATDQAIYYLHPGTPREVAIAKERLKRGPCVFCRKKRCGTVEHFPPQEWGGYDHPGLLYGACRTCNGRWGAWIQRIKAPELRPPGTLYVHDPGEVKPMARAALNVAFEHYRNRLAIGTDQAGLSVSASVERAFPFWLAVFERRYPLDVVVLTGSPEQVRRTRIPRERVGADWKRRRDSGFPGMPIW